MNIEEFQQLWHKYIAGQASPEEIKDLLRFIREGKGDAWLGEYIHNLDPENYRQIDLPEREWDDMWNRIQSDIKPSMPVFPNAENRPGRRIIIPLVRYGGWMVAASLLVVIGLNGLKNKSKTLTPAQTATATITAAPDRKPPSSVNAILTLENGKTIVLDSVAKGEVVTVPGARIMKLADGRIRYEAIQNDTKNVQYNTLTVPRGSKIVELILDDGSLAVLNAASSITYPSIFTGHQRTVQMSGEAYFEIVKNKAMPFIVKNGTTRVEVLGTHFNVNAYENENTTNVTLIEGSVKVSQLQNNRDIVLRPGQGAKIDDDIHLVDNVDVDEVLAWKAGKFKFGEYESIGTVMRQISRWYDVEIKYEGNVKGHIGGTISRQANVSQVLKLLEMTGVVKFKYDGEKITVMQNR